MNNTEKAVLELLEIIKIQKGQIEAVLEIIKNLKKRIEILENRAYTVKPGQALPFRHNY